MKKILIIAGEESGDLHGGHLVQALKTLYPDFEFSGMGGKKMWLAGVRIFFNIDRTGTVGLLEIFGNLWHYFSIYRKLASEIDSRQYDAIILIDYPTLNLIFAGHGKQVECPVYYFISPQIWAWRRGRIRTIRQRVKKMFVILPFEEPLYRESGVEVEFVGHPFVELVKSPLSIEEAKRSFELPSHSPVVGLLPGSRKNEIKTLLKPLIGAANQIRQKIPDCHFLLPIADSIKPEFIENWLGKNPLEIQTVSGRNYDLMKACDCLLMAAGSATLEAGILGRPMVVVYKLNPLTLWIARKLVKVEHFGLVNLLAGTRVVPELLQEEVTPKRMAEEALRFLKEPAYAKSVSDQLLKISQTLGLPGVAERTAKSICSDLGLETAHEKVLS